MRFERLLAIVPVSRLDPDPSQLSPRAAEAALAAYRALWHPGLLCHSESLPQWQPAEEPPQPEQVQGSLVLLPESGRELLPYDWEEQVELNDGQLVVAAADGQDPLGAVWEGLPSHQVQTVASIPADDFLALGTARLCLDMLAAYMNCADRLDEEQFRREVLAAASAAVLRETARRDEHLDQAFSLLDEARQQLYGADILLLDLCLVHPRAGMERLGQQLAWHLPVNLMLSGRTAEQMQRQVPEVAEQMRSALEGGWAELVGGQFDEVASSLRPLESQLWQFIRGRGSYRAVFGSGPSVFGRRRSGAAPYLFQMLGKLSLGRAIHFCFDGGKYPGVRETRVRFDAPNGPPIEALARVPVAAEQALDCIQFVHRLSESIATDFEATVALAHWPAPACQWYTDLLRIARRVPVLGRLVTLSEYFELTQPPAQAAAFNADQYTGPLLELGRSGRTPDPISGLAGHHRRRAAFEALRWLAAVRRVLSVSDGPGDPSLETLEEAVERQETDDAGIQAAVTEAAAGLAGLVLPRKGDCQPGKLLFNPLGWDRCVAITASQARSGPQQESASEPALAAPTPRVVTVPAMGFIWLPDSAERPATPKRRRAQADQTSLSNKFVRVELDTNTGGIRALRDQTTEMPLLAQRLTLVGVPGGSDQGDDEYMYGMDGYETDWWSFDCWMQASSIQVTAEGPELAEVVVEGELLVEPCPVWASESRMARFTQRYRLLGASQVLEISVQVHELVPEALPQEADPWETYLACRFIWPDARSTLVRGVGFLPEVTRSDRPCSPYFLEVHGRRHRTAILTGGLPFLRKEDKDKLDVLLLTAGEGCRQFDLAVGVDLPNPFRSALEMVSRPVIIQAVGDGRTGLAKGWFFHLDARNVVITGLGPLPGGQRGVRLRLFESAGQATTARLRCPLTVRRARLTDFMGQPLAEVEASGDAVDIPLAAHEYAQVEIELASRRP